MDTIIGFLYQVKYSPMDIEKNKTLKALGLGEEIRANWENIICQIWLLWLTENWNFLIDAENPNKAYYTTVGND